MFDLVLLFILLLTLLVGVLRGAIKEVFSAAVVVIAVMVTYYHSDIFLELFDVTPGPIVTPLSGIGVFVTSFIVLGLLNSWVMYLISPLRLGPIDRMLGCLCGLFRGGIYGYLLFALLNVFYYTLNSDDVKNNTEDVGYYLPVWLKHAKSYNVLNYFDSAVNSVIPEEVFISLRSYSLTLNGNVEEAQGKDDRVFFKGILDSFLDEEEELRNQKIWLKKSEGNNLAS